MRAMVEHAFPGLYHCPARWETGDGFIPVRVFACYAATLTALRAMDRLNMAAAIAMVWAQEQVASTMRSEALREAYPG